MVGGPLQSSLTCQLECKNRYAIVGTGQMINENSNGRNKSLDVDIMTGPSGINSCRSIDFAAFFKSINKCLLSDIHSI